MQSPSSSPEGSHPDLPPTQDSPEGPAASAPDIHPPPEGTERVIDGRLRAYFGGYWIKVYPVPDDTLVEKQRLIFALTRRLFNHVEHGLYVPGVRLDEARRAYEHESDPEKKRIKGGMLAAALFNRAADMLTKLVELQSLGIEIGPGDPLMRRCGQHLQEALSLGRLVKHRSGEEGIDELWGEPFKAFAFPIREFYHSRYIKLSMMMRCIDDLVLTTVPTLEQCPGHLGVGPMISALGEAAKEYAQSLRSDTDVFDTWSALAVAKEHLDAHRAQLPKRAPTAERNLALESEHLIKDVAQLLFYMARARVPMPKSAAEIGDRNRALSERIGTPTYPMSTGAAVLAQR